ncbi:hypothetical protein [Caldifermentibacillus hisashii]|nr:hypothetical protein [Caldifermentibacillus hisashii]MBU5344093.1 hypothetical protein [Caldifermentibacillus hisashii]
MATRFILVSFLRQKMLYFGDETFSRHLFEAENSLFWLRSLFSSTL